MKKPDAVFRELGQLYEFQKEIAKFKLRDRTTTDSRSAASGPNPPGKGSHGLCRFPLNQPPVTS